MNQEIIAAEKENKKRSKWKYVAYIVIVFVATAISLTVALWGDKFFKVIAAFQNADWIWALAMAGLMAFSYLIEGLIIKVFCRLYTRDYHLHQGVANAMIGAFYNDVTPGATGGQVMQVFTMKEQGIPISNAASILVMWFILYQTTLVGFDIVTLIVEAPMIPNIKPLEFGTNLFQIPVVIIIIAGFVLNISVIALLYFMSFSKTVHKFVLKHGIGFLAKIKIIKNPEKTRESLSIQVENFKIELKRLQSNIPVLILVIFLFVILLIARYSIPYFAGLSLHAYGPDYVFNIKDFADATFLCSFHQMCAGLIPLPGQAGVSEYFFYFLYYNFFQSLAPSSMSPEVLEANVNACQILWRSMTFYLVIIAGGFFAAFYHSRPKGGIQYANRETFVDLQLACFSDHEVKFDEKELSRRKTQSQLNENLYEEEEIDGPLLTKKPKASKKKAKKKEKNDEWDTINIG